MNHSVSDGRLAPPAGRGRPALHKQSVWRFSNDRFQARRQPSLFLPSVEKWDDWVELDPEAWPRRVEKHYQLVPTVCFNCESACGLLAYVDKETGQVTKFEGNPKHPASRGRLCAKGPATITQIHDPDRILYPMKRSGPRGAGNGRGLRGRSAGNFRRAHPQSVSGKSGEEVMYHVGRPDKTTLWIAPRRRGASTATTRTRTSVRHRRGSAICFGTIPTARRPTMPTRASFFCSRRISSPGTTSIRMPAHHRRKNGGSKTRVMDPRLSNTASMADYWMPSYPGTEAAVLLAMAMVILGENRFDATFVKNWTNWKSSKSTDFPPRAKVSKP